MMIKKYVVKILLYGAVIGVASAFVLFYYTNLRGLEPALAPGSRIETVVQKIPASAITNGLPLKLPPGFSISVFAKGLGNARVLGTGIDGNLWLSIPGQGKIVALPDKNNDGMADTVVPVVTGLNYPHGFAWRCPSENNCELYVAETDKIAVFDVDKKTLVISNKRKLVDLPSGGNHITRTIMFLPIESGISSTLPNQLLVSIGSTCNVCRENNPLRGTIQVLNVDVGEMKPFARGLRNSVFMTVNPSNNELWATEMGRDLLGDNIPPDEINIIEQGKNYGWPNCYGKNIHDLSFDKNVYIRNPCSEPFEMPSLVDIPAHSAPLGLAFVPNVGWPKDFANNLLVAYHGSWNRSIPTGYKVVRVKFDAQGKYLGTEDFISGWLTSNTQAFGRPVDILIKPGGEMYLSDDKAGVVYLVKYLGA